MSLSAHSRVPRARRDPINSADQALLVFRLAICRPLRPETLVMFLDDQRRGHDLVSVSDTTEPSQIVDVADTMAFCAAGNEQIDALALATVRPGGGPVTEDDDLWFEIAEVVEEQGLTLIDWLIIGRDGAHSMREFLGLGSLWVA